MQLTLRYLYASQRPPYPYLLGDAAHCVPRWPLSLVHDQGATALAVGATDYTVTPVRPLPRPLV